MTVIDSSITLAWLYNDERTDAVERVFDKVTIEGAWVPGIWRLEVANGLQQGVRQRRVDASFRAGAIVDLVSLDITIDPDTNLHAWTTTLDLGERFRLTLYDASYLELALRHRLPLATLDREMRTAAQQTGIELLGL